MKNPVNGMPLHGAVIALLIQAVMAATGTDARFTVPVDDVREYMGLHIATVGALSSLNINASPASFDDDDLTVIPSPPLERSPISSTPQAAPTVVRT